MTYTAPHGWIETYRQDQASRIKVVFHEDPNCRLIHEHDLRRVDRPGSASRCRACSPG